MGAVVRGPGGDGQGAAVAVLTGRAVGAFVNSVCCRGTAFNLFPRGVPTSRCRPGSGGSAVLAAASGVELHGRPRWIVGQDDRRCAAAIAGFRTVDARCVAVRERASGLDRHNNRCVNNASVPGRWLSYGGGAGSETGHSLRATWGSQNGQIETPE